MPLLAAGQQWEQWAQVGRAVEPCGRLVDVWSLTGGISAQMTVLEIALPEEQIRRLVVRQPAARLLERNPQAATDEYRILQIVQQVGVVTPAPRFLDQSGAIFPAPYLVMDYIAGEPDYAPTDVVDCAEQIAEQLAQIHQIHALSTAEDAQPQRADETGLDLSFLPAQAEQVARLWQARRDELDDSLDEPMIRSVLEPVWPLPSSNNPVLIHGDFWPGNLLWRAGQLVAVVDWEDAAVGNPLADVAITRLDMLMILGHAAMDAFTRRYRALTTLDFTQLPYWELVAALRPAGQLAEWAAGWPALGRPDITEESMRLAHRWFVQQAMERIRT